MRAFWPGVDLDAAHQQVGGPIVLVWDIDQLTALVKTRLKPMQYRPGLIDGFIARTGLDRRCG